MAFGSRGPGPRQSPEVRPTSTWTEYGLSAELLELLQNPAAVLRVVLVGVGGDLPQQGSVVARVARQRRDRLAEIVVADRRERLQDALVRPFARDEHLGQRAVPAALVQAGVEPVGVERFESGRGPPQSLLGRGGGGHPPQG